MRLSVRWLLLAKLASRLTRSTRSAGPRVILVQAARGEHWWPGVWSRCARVAGIAVRARAVTAPIIGSDGTRIPGLRLAGPCVYALSTAVLMFRLQPGGLPTTVTCAC